MRTSAVLLVRSILRKATASRILQLHKSATYGHQLPCLWDSPPQGFIILPRRWVSILRFSKQTQYKVKHKIECKIIVKSKPKHHHTC